MIICNVNALDDSDIITYLSRCVTLEKHVVMLYCNKNDYTNPYGQIRKCHYTGRKSPATTT